MALLYGCAGCLTAKNGGFRPGQLRMRTVCGDTPPDTRWLGWLLAGGGVLLAAARPDARAALSSRLPSLFETL